jgi:hypothetical protein
VRIDGEGGVPGLCSNTEGIVEFCKMHHKVIMGSIFHENGIHQKITLQFIQTLALQPDFKHNAKRNTDDITEIVTTKIENKENANPQVLKFILEHLKVKLTENYIHLDLGHLQSDWGIKILESSTCGWFAQIGKDKRGD